jgi:cytochrome b6-f complex iron-sulfur subunit
LESLSTAMAKKRKEPEHAEQVVERRSFLNTLWAFLGFAALAGLAWVVVGFFRPRKGRDREGRAGGMVPCGSADTFAADSVTAFPLGQFYLARVAEGGFLALSRKCTHLGCTVPWVEEKKQFACPCHASAYDITGNVVSGPASRALDLFPVFIENNVVMVDTRRTIRRSVFRREQLVFPEGS